MTLKVVELFAGIGAQAQALENLGIDYESVVCEIDMYAYQSYCAIHGETENLGDICEVRQLPDCDLLTYSFPCQDLSMAGKMKGMSKDSGTRSSLLWEVGRLLADSVEREREPAVLLMENVAQVHGKKNLADWNAWLDFLSSLGYTNSWADLNAMDYGVPQSRIRCFMISTRDGSHYQFPKGWKLDRCLKDVLEENVDESFYLSEKSIEGYQRRKADHVSRGVNFGWEPTEGEGVARCINTVPQKDCQNFIVMAGNLNRYDFDIANRVYSPEGASPTIRARRDTSLIEVPPRIRYLTPLECWRLMGFSDEAYSRAKAIGTSKTQLYKQAGNSIVVDVLMAIFKPLYIEKKKGQPTLEAWN